MIFIFNLKDVPLQVEHIRPRSKGGSNSISNLTLSCEKCNLKKGTQDIKDFLKKEPKKLESILKLCSRPLADAAAVNTTRFALLNALKATNLPVETGSGGLTKFNRSQQNLDKTHWVDAACVGLGTPILNIKGVKPLSDRSGNSVGKVYLVDFGSVQTVAAKEGGTMTVVGTYGYMAPEQFGGRAVPASDIYSLGATLIYLVTGSHPADLPQVDLKIQFEDKANVSKEFVEWLKLITAPSLNRRCSSPEEALAILDKPISISNQLSPIIHPIESKIKINKTKEYIEVYMPPLGIKPIMLLISIVWNITMYFGAMTFTNIIIEYGIEKLITLGILSVTSILTCLLAWVAVIWTTYMTTFLFFGQNYLKIDQNQICNYYKVFNRFKLTFFRSLPRSLIDKIVYVPKSTTYLIPPQLTIWAGIHRFPIMNLSRDVIYSEREIQWLAYELSDWLGIPISHD